MTGRSGERGRGVPELPEAESNRARIEAEALNRTISEIVRGEVSHIDVPSPAEGERLVGHRFTEARRHGKYIFAGSKSGPWIAVHLGMSGSLRPYDEEDGAPDHARWTVAFEGARRLAFCCPRKLGWVRVIDDPDAFLTDKKVGPDILSMGETAFADAIGGTRGAIKSALMNQKKVAGIGNLWSDEILFQTGTSREARGGDLPPDRIAGLYRTARTILSRLVREDAEYDRLPEDWLIHARSSGRGCPRCSGTIGMRKVGGRSAFFCDAHQVRI
ncbi:DNA-formamidopyrimidine glycosylase family protein [Roseicyclus sp. F158]|uniref:DNA-formamidopyrimidine glycosylase family protein n=1 Tax=Tropicimonas omnivorans TaxID=3075590 RepID=A0ABU3DI42_9RHOB|nr:DNA-formamidopyrimidine glycosylase family protein [Roseicyclus sp. F158]MDT0683379.1 DNA-formamidopyrimidine glycosylase family protein [Roseicyclus sp. F158]